MKQIEVKAFVNHADGVSEKCRVCSGDVYGHAGDMEIPLCKEHCKNHAVILFLWRQRRLPI